MVGVQFSAVIATSVLAVLIARTLGPSDYGVFSGVFGLAQAFAVITQFGLTTWLLRELTALRVPNSSTTGTGASRITGALGVTSLLGFVAVLSVAAISTIAGLSVVTRAALLGLLIYTVSISLAMILESVFRAEREVSAVAKATLLEKGLLVGIVSVALLGGGAILAITAAYVVSGTARLLFDLVHLRGRQLFAGSALSFTYLLRTARDAFPFAMNATLVVMIVRLDIVLIAISSAAAAGYFSVADRVLGVLLLMPVAASAALYPHLASDVNRLHAAWQAGRRMAVLVFVPTVIGVMTAPALIPAVFGPDFAAAVRSVQLLLLVAPFAAFANGLVAGLCSAGRERALLIRTAPIMLLGSGAVLIGAILNGAEGAALAYVARALIFTFAVAMLARSTQAKWST